MFFLFCAIVIPTREQFRRDSSGLVSALHQDYEKNILSIAFTYYGVMESEITVILLRAIGWKQMVVVTRKIQN